MTDTDRLAALLREQGWKPDSNVCRCGHLGGDHSLSNRCLICEDDYFVSYSQTELWERAAARLIAAGVTVQPSEQDDPTVPPLECERGQWPSDNYPEWCRIHQSDWAIGDPTCDAPPAPLNVGAAMVATHMRQMTALSRRRWPAIKQCDGFTIITDRAYQGFDAMPDLGYPEPRFWCRSIEVRRDADGRIGWGIGSQAEAYAMAIQKIEETP